MKKHDLSAVCFKLKEKVTLPPCGQTPKALQQLAWLRKKCHYEKWIIMLNINASKQDGQQPIKLFK